MSTYTDFAVAVDPGMDLTLPERLIQLAEALSAMPRRFEGLIMDYSLSMVVHEDFHAAINQFNNTFGLSVGILSADEHLALVNFLAIQRTDGSDVGARNYILQALTLCRMISDRINANSVVANRQIAPFSAEEVQGSSISVGLSGESNGNMILRLNGAETQWVSAGTVNYTFNGITNTDGATEMPEQIAGEKPMPPSEGREPSLAEVWRD